MSLLISWGHCDHWMPPEQAVLILPKCSASLGIETETSSMLVWNYTYVWLKDMIFFPPEPSKFQFCKEVTEVWCHKLRMEIDWAPQGWDRKCFVVWYARALGPVPRTTHRQILKWGMGTILSCFVKFIFFSIMACWQMLLYLNIYTYTQTF